MDILSKLAGNKTIANLAFRAIRKHIKEDNISFIVIFIDNNGDIAAKEYKEPMVIMRQEDYEDLQTAINAFNIQVKPKENNVQS